MKTECNELHIHHRTYKTSRTHIYYYVAFLLLLTSVCKHLAAETRPAAGPLREMLSHSTCYSNLGLLCPILDFQMQQMLSAKVLDSRQASPVSGLIYTWSHAIEIDAMSNIKNVLHKHKCSFWTEQAGWSVSSLVLRTWCPWCAKRIQIFINLTRELFSTLLQSVLSQLWPRGDGSISECPHVASILDYRD